MGALHEISAPKSLSPLTKITVPEVEIVKGKGLSADFIPLVIANYRGQC